MKPVDTTRPDIADVVGDWAAMKGTVGIRIMLNQTASADPADPGINRTLAAAAQHSLPVNMLIWGRLDQAKGLAARNPNTVLVIDHLGLQQPFHPPPPKEPWAELPKVLSLAEHDNVRIKISGACTLSHEPSPITTSGTSHADHRHVPPGSLYVGHRLDPGDRTAHL